MSDPKWPVDYTTHEKEILIHIMTECGYGHPDYTNDKELDYKFFEDTDMSDHLFVLVREIAKLREYKLAAEFAIKELESKGCDLCFNNLQSNALGFLQNNYPERFKGSHRVLGAVAKNVS